MRQLRRAATVRLDGEELRIPADVGDERDSPVRNRLGSERGADCDSDGQREECGNCGSNHDTLPFSFE